MRTTGEGTSGRTGIGVALALSLLVGCQAKPKSQPAPTVTPLADNAKAVISNTDESASKLHDIEGALLMYFALNKRLPDKIDDAFPLADVPLDFDCPGAGGPYVYTPDGFLLQDRQSRIVVFEPKPMHSGYRLAISMADPQATVAPVCKVIALPESFFLLRPPEAALPAEAALQPPAPPPSPAAVDRPRATPGTRR